MNYKVTDHQYRIGADDRACCEYPAMSHDPNAPAYPAGTADAIRRAVAAVLKDEHWEDSVDTASVVVTEDGMFMVPGTFGSDTGVWGISDSEIVLQFDADENDPPEDQPGRIFVDRNTYAVAYEAECPWHKHGMTRITSQQAFTGYAGGRCYATGYACGCTDLDESDDVRAAR